MWGSGKPLRKMSDAELRKELVRAHQQQAAEASPGRPASRAADRAVITAITETQKRGGFFR